MNIQKIILPCTVASLLLVSPFSISVKAEEDVLTSGASSQIDTVTTTTVTVDSDTNNKADSDDDSSLYDGVQDIYEQLKEFANSEMNCYIASGKLVVFSDESQEVLDEVAAYCEESGIDSSLVQLILIVPEENSEGTATDSDNDSNNDANNASLEDDDTLPSTGNNKLTSWLTAFGSLMAIFAGAFAVLKSGFIRKKEN